MSHTLPSPFLSLLRFVATPTDVTDVGPDAEVTSEQDALILLQVVELPSLQLLDRQDVQRAGWSCTPLHLRHAVHASILPPVTLAASLCVLELNATLSPGDFTSVLATAIVSGAVLWRS